MVKVNKSKMVNRASLLSAKKTSPSLETLNKAKNFEYHIVGEYLLAKPIK